MRLGTGVDSPSLEINMNPSLLAVCLAPFHPAVVAFAAAGIPLPPLFADRTMGILAGILASILAGLVAAGVLFKLGLGTRPVNEPSPRPDQAPGGNPSPAKPRKLISRIVSWTSMVYRGGYNARSHSVHRRGGSVDVFITDAARESGPIRGWVVERSVHTLTLAAAAAFPVGTVAKVRPQHAPENIPWVEAEVLECEQVEMEWRVVCKFVKIPPYGVLMLFG